MYQKEHTRQNNRKSNKQKIKTSHIRTWDSLPKGYSAEGGTILKTHINDKKKLCSSRLTVCATHMSLNQGSRGQCPTPCLDILGRQALAMAGPGLKPRASVSTATSTHSRRQDSGRGERAVTIGSMDIPELLQKLQKFSLQRRAVRHPRRLHEKP